MRPAHMRPRPEFHEIEIETETEKCSQDSVSLHYVHSTSHIHTYRMRVLVYIQLTSVSTFWTLSIQWCVFGLWLCQHWLTGFLLCLDLLLKCYPWFVIADHFWRFT